MGNRMDRLVEMGLKVPAAPVPLGSYLPAKRIGNLVYISGQLPIREGTLLFKGKVGAQLDLAQGQAAAQLCFLNTLSALAYLGISLEQVTQVIRLAGFIQCIDGYADQAKVMNGASDLCQSIFGEIGRHARAAVGVFSLPMDAAVEIEALFEVAD